MEYLLSLDFMTENKTVQQVIMKETTSLKTMPIAVPMKELIFVP